MGLNKVMFHALAVLFVLVCNFIFVIFAFFQFFVFYYTNSDFVIIFKVLVQRQADAADQDEPTVSTL